MESSCFKIVNEFHDFDHYASEIAQGDVEHFQISKGSFEGALQQVISENIIISAHRMNQLIVQQGSGLNGFVTFLISGDSDQDFAWRKIRIKANIIGILHDGMEHYSVLRKNFCGIPVSVKKEYLYEMAQRMGCLGFIDIVKKNEFVEIHRQDSSRLQMLIRKLVLMRGDYGPMLLKITRDLIYAILRSSKSTQNGIGNSRRRIFEHGLKHIVRNSHNPIKISQLCKDLGVSERNLRYAFQDSSGLSPKQFSDRYRLNLVRSDLKSGNAKHVIDACHSYGYWHTGKFASDYKMLFDEYPSATLKMNLINS